MDTLISDGGKYEISKRVTNLLHSLFIQDYQSEHYHQHQNKAENHFGLAKRYTNTVMNTSGCPAYCWLLCLHDGTLTLPFSWVVVSPLQNRIGLSMGHTVANSQCLLRMSAGLLLPSFKWNEMYLAAIASLTQ